jgi:NAD(P)-dependent dehydrogenase (short-subunit alcohol dehydrogenase family)
MSKASKIALITGGSRGLGKNTALKLAECGNDVILTYRSSRTEAQTVVNEILRLGRRAVALPLDVEIASTFPDFAVKVHGALKTFERERFDFLINDAGIGVYASFAETTESQFDQLVNSHLKGTFFLT